MGTTTMKANELTGAALDWAVAQCEGIQLNPAFKKSAWISYSSDWAQGGPIIEREGLSVSLNGDGLWVSYRTETLFDDDYEHEYQTADTPLIAAMRCYVASKLGEEVQIPEELC